MRYFVRSIHPCRSADKDWNVANVECVSACAAERMCDLWNEISQHRQFHVAETDQREAGRTRSGIEEPLRPQDLAGFDLTVPDRLHRVQTNIGWPIFPRKKG